MTPLAYGDEMEPDTSTGGTVTPLSDGPGRDTPSFPRKDAGDAGNRHADELQRLIWVMEKLPRKEPGSPAFWQTVGRVVGGLERIRDELREGR